MDQPPESNELPESLKPTLPVEETPIIELIPEPAPPQTPLTAPKGRGCGKLLGNLFFFIILFGLGVWLSTQVRVLFVPVVPEEQVLPSPSPTLFTEASGSAIKNDGWTSYPLSAEAGEKGMNEVAYQLPIAVLAPVCDSTSCISRGTNLPGGTRFTVALRGTGYPLPDFRGAILTDTTGKEFVMKQTVVGGKDVYEYTGNFTGRTGGGYTFTKMRGVLIPITATTSVDFNHFSPTGITSDFVSDDVLFNQIVERLTIPR